MVVEGLTPEPAASYHLWTAKTCWESFRHSQMQLVNPASMGCWILGGEHLRFFRNASIYCCNNIAFGNLLCCGDAEFGTMQGAAVKAQGLRKNGPLKASSSIHSVHPALPTTLANRIMLVFSSTGTCYKPQHKFGGGWYVCRERAFHTRKQITVCTGFNGEKGRSRSHLFDHGICYQFDLKKRPQ